MSLITTHAGVTTVIFAVSALFMVLFTLQFNRQFVHPVRGLVGLIMNTKACGYNEEVDAEEIIS